MKNFTYKIDNQVFESFPKYIRAVVVIQNVSNSPTVSQVTSQLHETIKQLRMEFGNSEQLMHHPNIVAWREAFKKDHYGSDFRPSFEALLRRVINNPDSLRPISTLVDLGTLLSITYKLPIGVHEISTNTTEIVLKRAIGNEAFVEFGKEAIEHPNPNEIILIENNEVLTRRWVWRQGRKSIITLETKNIYVNIDTLGYAREEILSIAQDVQSKIVTNCRGKASIHLLHKEEPSFFK